MVKPRIIETDQGITGEFNTKTYDEMMRRMRDRGWIETKMIISAGLSSGLALEVGPGPGTLAWSGSSILRALPSADWTSART